MWFLSISVYDTTTCKKAFSFLYKQRIHQHKLYSFQILYFFWTKFVKLLTYHIGLYLSPINRRKVINSAKQSGFLAHPIAADRSIFQQKWAVGFLAERSSVNNTPGVECWCWQVKHRRERWAVHSLSRPHCGESYPSVDDRMTSLSLHTSPRRRLKERSHHSPQLIPYDFIFIITERARSRGKLGRIFTARVTHNA